MATQTRVPGAASSEVDFELERFERTAEDRIEIAGRWFGLRGLRFVRLVLNLNAGGSRRRAIALLEHKPWAADDGQTWLAAFRWPEGAGEVDGAELEVGPGLVVELPALGGTSVRVSALRPHVPAAPERKLDPAEEDGGDGELAGAVTASRPVHDWTPTPPRDVLTAALAERDEATAARDQAESERVTALNDRDDALSRRDAALRDVDRAVGERDEAIAERDRLAAELERVTRERDHAHAERNRTLQDSEAIQRERDQAAAERDAARSELSRAIPAREEAIRERDAQAVRADRAESERDTAFVERKSAVAQRDRARRERDRAMRAAGIEPPQESPYVAAGSRGAADAADAAGPRDASDAADAAGSRGAADAADAAGPRDASDAADAAGLRGAARPPGSASSSGAASPPGAESPPDAVPPGTPLPSRPLKRIGAAPVGSAPEPKSLLTRVDSGPRRLSRTRRTPSAPARWAVRIIVVLLLVAIAAVLAMLLGSVV